MEVIKCRKHKNELALFSYIRIHWNYMFKKVSVCLSVCLTQKRELGRKIEALVLWEARQKNKEEVLSQNRSG